MKRCNKNGCRTCPFVNETKQVKSEVTGENFPINYPSNCQTSNLIYCIVCLKCKVNYIGETSKTLDQRFRQHLGYVNNKKLNEPTGYHFNLPNHNISMMQISVLEKVWKSDNIRKIRETMYISKFDSKHHGMNRKDYLFSVLFMARQNM